MRKTKAASDYSWINDSPTEDEVETNADGSQFIPIFHVEKKLYRLDTHWGTENLRFNLWVGKSGLMFASGSLELVVTYGGRTRKLVGAATLLVPADTDFDDPFVNSNFEATIKSECVKNGSKAIGISFGQGLNDRGIITTPATKPSKNGKQKPPPAEMKPDEKMQKQFNNAWDNGNLDMIDKIKIIYPNIQYVKPTTNVES